MAPRALHLAPDGRVVVADQGSGAGDGRVVAIDVDAGTREVLVTGLPSTLDSGQRYADLAGPSGAAVDAAGTICVAIGDGGGRPGFGMLRCSDGDDVDLRAYEREHNPDGLEVASNPYDVISDGAGGWFVSDAAANDVLHVAEDGAVRVALVVASLADLTGSDTQGVPTGLGLRPDGTLLVALLGGDPVGANGAYIVVPRLADGVMAIPQLGAALPAAIAVTADGAFDLVVSHTDGGGAGGIMRHASDGSVPPTTFAGDLAAPTGLVVLADGSVLVSRLGESALTRLDGPG